MKKITKPANVFWTKPHSYPPPLLGKLQKTVFANKKLKEVSAIVDLLNSETRLMVLVSLERKKWICVGDLADISRLSISAVSHQLRLLREASWVERRKKGKVVYYNLSEKLPAFVLVLLKQSLG